MRYLAALLLVIVLVGAASAQRPVYPHYRPVYPAVTYPVYRQPVPYVPPVVYPVQQPLYPYMPAVQYPAYRPAPSWGYQSSWWYRW